MATAAVPKYLGLDFSHCPSGHRFTLYGAFWEPDKGWNRIKNIEAAALDRDFGKMPKVAGEQGAALRDRQRASATTLGESVAIFEAKSTAPLVTGTGIEHPLENGMTFLSPYGVPYLPGSSVKGVLRRAAQELAGVFEDARWHKQTAWTHEAIEVLFGKEPPPGSDDASCGALAFWDVIPNCKGLRIEIMNPHHGDYYQGKHSSLYPDGPTPHDSGNPIPIYFLTVSEDSPFTFYVQCNPRRVPEGLDWRALIEEAFEHAFDWLGFGAKTAVGYGAMQLDREKEAAARKLQEAEEAERQRAAEEAARKQAEKEEARHKLPEGDPRPESDKRLHRFQQALATVNGAPPLNKDAFGTLKGLINALAQDAGAWDAADRVKAADAIEAAFERFGWTPSGLRSDKRKKQENKHRELIARLRG